MSTDDLSGSIGPTQQQPAIYRQSEPSTGQNPELSLRSNQGKSDPFRCQLCGRVYERADHLHRHLRNHENLRPHKCTQCPKRFNRADLLRRHVLSHDRSPMARTKAHAAITRSSRRERVAAACLACVASKSKCQDEKPCARCQHRQIECVSNPAPGNLRPESAQPAVLDERPSSPGRREDLSASSHNSHGMPGLDTTPADALIDAMSSSNEHSNFVRQGQSQSSIADFHGQEQFENNRVQNFDPFEHFPVPFAHDELQLQHGSSIMPRDAYIGQEIDFGLWNFDLEGIELAYQDIQHDQAAQKPPQPTYIEATNGSGSVSRRSAAFGRSTWIWNPTQNDQAMNDQNHLQLDEGSITSMLTPGSPEIDTEQFAFCFTTATRRDQILGILYTIRRDATQTPSLPSLPLLNKIIQHYFMLSSQWVDHMIHAASFDGSQALSQLLLAIIAAGSTLISAPAIFKMGLALQDVVRHTVGEFWEQNNSNTRNLQSLQAFVISLDIGLWSGFKRKMEIAESFGQPVIAILRRAGVFAIPKLPSSSSPRLNDSEAVLEAKWQKWVERESFKRLALHMFAHDVFASVGLQKPPLILFTELKFELPASESLWHARSALEWREEYIASETVDHNIPKFTEIMRDPAQLIQHSRRVNVHLSSMVILHSFWGQIHGFLDAKKYHSHSNSTHQLSILTTRNELYRDLTTFAARLSELTNHSANAILLAELFLMIFNVNLEDVQRFAGRFGEEEAAEATGEFKIWANTVEARTAVWHAAHVIRAAKNLPPGALMAFNAIAIYYAILTLWIYGMMAPQPPTWNETHNAQFTSPNQRSVSDAVLNEVDGPETRAFRNNGIGTPGIIAVGCTGKDFIPLWKADRILQFARHLYQENCSFEDQPLPPLVEGLCDLLKELESLPGSRMSRAQSESTR